MFRLRSFSFLSLIALVVLVFGGQPVAALPLPDAPTFGDLTFSTGFDTDANIPIGTATTFGSDTSQLYASWEYSGARAGEPYTAIWYWDGLPIGEHPGEFESTDGVTYDNIYYEDGSPLPGGIFEFALVLASGTVLEGGCEITDTPGPDEPAPVDDGLPRIGAVTFSTGFDWDTLTPVDPGTHFPSDTVRLHVSWEYSGATVGTPFKGIWTPTGDWSDARGEFERTEGVMTTAITTPDGQPLPEGIYGFSGIVNGEVLFYDQCEVGAAPEPDEPLPVDDGLPDFGPVSITAEYDETLDEPVGSATRFDEGVMTLYFYCSFENMPDGALGIATVYHDQLFLYQSDIVFDFPDGMWWEVVENPDGSALAPGAYSVIFEVDGRPSAFGDCIVGDASPPVPVGGTGTPALRSAPTAAPSRQVPAPDNSKTRPVISDIVFCEDVTDDGEVIGAAETFPAGTTAVWAFFTYDNMKDGMPWGEVWLENGEEFYTDLELVWEDGPDGWLALQLTNEPLPLAGEYSLTVHVEGNPVQSGTFTVEMAIPTDLPTAAPVPQQTSEKPPGGWSGESGVENGPKTQPVRIPTFGPMHFATEFDQAAGRPVGSVKVLKPGIDSFYIYADWEGADPGTEVLIFVLYRNPLLGKDHLIYLNMGTLQDSSGTLWHEIYNVVEEIALLPGLYMVAVSLEGEDIAGGQIMMSPDIEAAEEYFSAHPIPTQEPASPEPQPTEATAEPVATPGIPGLEFGPIELTTQFDAREMRPVGSTSLIKPGSSHFYAYAEFKIAEPGVLFATDGLYFDPDLGQWKRVYYSTDYRSEAEGLWWDQVQDNQAGEFRPGTYLLKVTVSDDGSNRTVGTIEVPVGSGTTDLHGQQP